MKVRGPSWSPIGDLPATGYGRRVRRVQRNHMIVHPAAMQPGLVHLRLADDSIVPTLEVIREWIAVIRAEPTVDTIRTSALFPRSSDRFLEAGFTVADTLRLLRADLTSSPVRAAIAGNTVDGSRATVTLRGRDYRAAARVDRAAFGPSWGHDAAELEEIRHATPLCRARARVHRGGLFRRDVEAFAIAGASSEHGYLQRLSVDPTLQRIGHGRQLTVDALRWMMRRGLPDCLVNTSVDNTAALALYDSVGFQPMREGLRVLHFHVRQPV